MKGILYLFGVILLIGFGLVASLRLLFSAVTRTDTPVTPELNLEVASPTPY